MHEKQKLLIVDDEEINRFLYERAFGKEYDIRSAESGEVCLDIINDFFPDIFLLDVHMPGGMDGYELCQEIRNKKQFNNSLIFFLSGLEEPEKKIYGYQVGADDFINKEFGFDLLKVKIDTQLKRIKTSNEAVFKAKTAMRNAGEVSPLVSFYEGIHDSGSYQELAEQVIEVCTSYDVNAAILLRLSDSVVSLSTTGVVNSSENEFMLEERNTTRIHIYEECCLFNFKGAILLIRKMPEDADKDGRFREYFTSVMSGVEARMRSLNAELTLQVQNDNLVLDVLNGTYSALDSMKGEFKKHDFLSKNMIEKLISEMHLAFSDLNLNEEQEKHLMGVVSKSMVNMTDLASAGMNLDQQFESVTLSLEQIIAPNYINGV